MGSRSPGFPVMITDGLTKTQRVGLMEKPVCLDYLSVSQGKSFTYYSNPEFFPLNREAPDAPYRFKPGGVIAVEVNFFTEHNKPVE